MIFAIVVTYNGMKWIDRCIKSLELSEMPVSIVIVDNASEDGTVQYINSTFPDVNVLPQVKNLGFAKANNIGIKYALDHDASSVFLLNQDAWVSSETIGCLHNIICSRGNIGIASPVHLSGSGQSLDTMFASYMPPDFVSDSFMGKLDIMYEVKFVNAASWLISRMCIQKVGGFDTSVFVHYGEDDNFCQRVRFHGFRIVVCPQCHICHDREQRSSSEDEYRRRVFRTPDLPRRIELADINKGYDVRKMILQQKKLWWRKLLTFRFASTSKHSREIEFLSLIMKSREINTDGGLNWL